MDGYNMSSAISLGNSRMGAVQDMNESIRQFNSKAIDAAKGAAKVAVGNDKQEGIMSGIKDSLTESVAVSNFKTSLDNYNNLKKGTGFGGWSEVKPTPDELKPKAALAGEEVDQLAEKPSAAVTTSEGTFAEGSDVLSDAAKGGFSEASKVASSGAKVAGALGKGVGVLGGIASSGLDIAADIKAKGIAGDNWEEKLGNVATIGGTALDMLGFIPGLQLAGVVGTALQAAGGVASAAGEAVDTVKKIATDTKPTDPVPLQQTAQASLAGSFAATR
jgi:hypothetical protein